MIVSYIAFLAIAFIVWTIMFSWVDRRPLSQSLVEPEPKPKYYKDFGILIATAILFVCLLSFKDRLEKCQKEINVPSTTVKIK